MGLFYPQIPGQEFASNLFSGVSRTTDLVTTGLTVLILDNAQELRFPVTGTITPGLIYRVKVTGAVTSASVNDANNSLAGQLVSYDNTNGSMSIVVDTVVTGALNTGGTGSLWTIVPTTPVVSTTTPPYLQGTPFPWVSGSQYVSGGTVPFDDFSTGYAVKPAVPNATASGDTNTTPVWPPYPFSSSAMPPSYHT